MSDEKCSSGDWVADREWRTCGLDAIRGEGTCIDHLDEKECRSALVRMDRDAARLLSAGEALAGAAAGHHHSHAVAGRDLIEWCEICQALSVWHETVKAVGEGTENDLTPAGEGE